MKEKINKKIFYEKKSPTTFLLEESLKLFGDSLVSIVLFGSRARKNYTNYSDFDVIIVIKDDKNYETSKLIKSFLLKYQNSLDLHIFSREDMLINFRDFSPMFSTLLLGKVILFDRDKFFREAFKNFIKNIISYNIIYCEGGNIWELSKIAKNLEISL